MLYRCPLRVFVGQPFAFVDPTANKRQLQEQQVLPELHIRFFNSCEHTTNLRDGVVGRFRGAARQKAGELCALGEWMLALSV